MSKNRRSILRSTLQRIRGLFERREQSRREMRRLIGTHFEWLEPRAMMTLPSFTALPTTPTVLGGAPTWFGLTGTAPNGGALTYTVSSSNPNLVQAIIPTGNRSLVLNTTGTAAGVTGQMTFQLFDNLVHDVTDHIANLVNHGDFNTSSGLSPDFYRVVSGFVIQAGPHYSNQTDSSSLGPFDDEYSPDLQFTTGGLLAMAKSSDDTNDAQIFITDTATRSLDFNHSIFGVLTSGDSVRHAIQTAGDVAPGNGTAKASIQTAQIVPSDPLNGALELKAAPGASGTADVIVTVTDSTGQHFSQTLHVTVTPDTNNPAPFLSSITPSQPTQDGHAVTGFTGQPITLQLAATDVQNAEVQQITLNSTGSTTFSFNGASATSAILLSDQTTRVTITNTGSSNTGTFTLTANGLTTAPITASSATPATVLAALNAVSAFNGKVTVTAGPGSTAANPQFDIKFVSGFSIATQDPTGTSGTAGTASLVASASTDMTAAKIQANLNTISALKDNVSVTGTTGGPFLVSFIGPLANKDVATLSVNNANASVQTVAKDFFDVNIAGTEPGGYTATVDHATGIVTLTPSANSTFAGTFKATVSVRGVTNARTTVVDQPDTETLTVTVKPSTPTVDLVDASDTGVSHTDNITGAASLDFLVTNVTAGAVVKLMKGQTQLATGTVAAGANSITLTVPSAPTTLGQGPSGLTAIQTLSGSDSDASSTLNVTIDSTQPTFSSTAPTSAIATFPLTYDAQTNEEGASSGLVYTLTGAPTGATINSSTGVLTWTPTIGQIGTQTFNIVATDAAGNAATQPVTVEVESPLVDIKLSLTKPDGTPLTSLAIGQDFVLHVATQDVRAAGSAQELTFSSDATGGTFTLTITSGSTTKTTDPITYSTTAATTQANIKAAIDAAFGAGFSAVSANSTTLFDIAFPTASTLPTMTVASQSLTGGTQQAPATVTAAAVAPHGIFALFTDVTYDSAKATVTGSITHAATYAGAPSGDTSQAGLINEAGGISGVPETGSGAIEVFSVPMKATAAGTLTFATDPADDTGAHGVLVYGGLNSDNVPNEQIHFGTASIEVGSTFNAVDDSFTVNEDSSNNAINPLTNDTNVGSNQNTLTITAVGTTNHGGTVTISSDGKSLKYTPAALFVGTETFTYTAKNQNNETHTATVTMTVTGVNHAPTANNDTFGVPKSSTSNTLDVLANDTTTPDTGETLHVTDIPTKPTHGTVTIGANGANIIYTPTANFTGTDTFTYKISDRATGGLTSTATVSVKVGGLTATTDSFTVSKGASATTLDVLANDSLGDAPAGSTLTITAVTQGNHGGTVALAADNKTVNYTPASSFQGTENFTYTISDGHGNTSTGTVNMTVNGPPTANNDNPTTVFQGTNTLDVLANDVSGTTPPGTLTIDSGSLTQPTHGTVSVSTDGKKIIYTPTGSYTGTDSFTYKAKGTDNQLSQAATVSFTVQPFVASSLAGFVYFDVNNNGTKDANELPIVGITITLTGTPTAGDTTAVNRTIKTGDDGSYKLDGIAPGSYTLTETQPAFVIDGKVTAGSSGGTAGTNKISSITIGSTATGTTGTNNNFGERGRDVHTINLRDYFSSNSRNYAQTAFDGSGNELWHTLNGNVWTGYTNDAFSLITNKTTIQLQATNTQSQTVTATLAAADLPVYLNGTASGNLLYHVPGSPAVSGFTSSPGPTNQSPTANADTYFTPINSPLTITAANGVLKNDTDPDTNTTLKATIAGQPSHGTVTLNNDGSFTYTPTSATFTGSDSFTYKASDGTNQSNTATVTINVGITANADSYVATEGQALTVQGSASNGILKNDVGGAAALQVVPNSASTPTHGTVTVAADGTFTYTPAPNFNGSDSFTYKATDGTNQSGVATVSIVVTAVNSPPVAANDILTATKNTPSTVNAPGVLGNDHDPDDADNTLAIASSSVGTKPTTHGSVTINVNGSYTYTPATDYVGPDSFSYTVTDPHGGTADATVSISVNPAPPVATPDAYTTDTGTTLTIDAAHGLLANDTAANIGQVNAIKVADGTHGTVTVDPSGSFVYTPTNSTYTGPDTFTYKAQDSNGDSAITAVTITINALPVANDDQLSASRSTPLTIQPADLLTNDTFVTTTAGPHKIVKSSNPGHGSVTVNADGSFTYTPAPGYIGPDSFTYKANDGIADSASAATVNITVVNHAPVLDQITDQTVDELQQLTFTAHATDPDQNTTFTFSLADGVSGSVPAGASFTGDVFSWTPTEAQGPGTYTFDVVVSDGDKTDSQTIHVTVNEVNAAPSGADKTITTDENVPITFSGADFGLTDPNDTPANTLSAVKIGTLPAVGTLKLDGTAVVADQEITAADLGAGKLVFTPGTNDHGTAYATFTFQVRDNGGTAFGGVDLSSAANTLTINVTAVNQAPVVQDDGPYTTDEDTTLPVDVTRNVLTNDSDPEGDQMHVLIVTQPVNGHVTLNDDGTFEFVPNPDFNGTDHFTYQANDGPHTSTTATVTLTVTPVNDAPVGITDSYDVAQGGMKEVTLFADGVLGNDMDADGDQLTAHIVSLPLHGTVSLSADGTFTYTNTDTTFSGQDSFTYQPKDATTFGNETIVTIDVHAPPIVNPDSYTATQDTQLIEDGNSGVLANDMTSGGHPITDVTVVDQAIHGIVSMHADGSFEYMPDASYTGPDSFTYTATDGVATSAPVTVSLDVQAEGEGEAFDAALLSLMNSSSNPTNSSSYTAAVDYLMAQLG
jgi:VCBS repeat-containing protein